MDEYLTEKSDVRKWLREWSKATVEWRQEAANNYKMVANNQWDEEDIAQMSEAKRPIVSFNRVAALIRGICGLEVNNRQAVRYLPRELGDVQTNEILTAAASWVRQECNAEDEESDAFRDTIICGMGFVETWVDYVSDPQGKIMIERLSPLSCAWDTHAHKRSLQDARWLATWKDICPEDFELLFPGKLEELHAASKSTPDFEYGIGSPVEEDYNAPWSNFSAGKGEDRKLIRVVQIQYWENEEYYRIFSDDGSFYDLSKKQYKEAEEQILVSGFDVKKFKKRVYKQKFIAGDLDLKEEVLPTDSFTIQVITGIRNEVSNTWYGIVRDLKDPQKWANKFFSLIIDILSTQAKGGLLAEINAFLDDRQAEEDWADPRKIVWLKPGGLAKIKDRVSNTIPPSLPALMEYANNLIPQTSGVSLEFLGITDKVQAGVLEYQRRQATIGTLAEFFAALRLYRKNQGKVLAKFIQIYLNDGRLIRIVGPDQERFVPLLLDKTAIEYDVVVDEAPNSPDIKGRTWAAMAEVMPFAVKMGLPIPPDVLDYSPFPSSLVAKWKEMIAQGAQQQQIPPQLQQQIEQMAQEMTQLQQENQKLKLGREEKLAELQLQKELKLLELQNNLQIEAEKLKLKRAVDAANVMIKADKAKER